MEQIQLPARQTHKATVRKVAGTGVSSVGLILDSGQKPGDYTRMSGAIPQACAAVRIDAQVAIQPKLLIADPTQKADVPGIVAVAYIGHEACFPAQPFPVLSGYKSQHSFYMLPHWPVPPPPDREEEEVLEWKVRRPC